MIPFLSQDIEFIRVRKHLFPMTRRVREIGLTVICGIAGCLAALAFDDAIHVLHRVIWLPLERGGPWVFAAGGLGVLLSVGLVTGWMLSAWAPEAAGSGIPQLKVAYWRDMGRISGKAVWVKFLAGAISIGGGMSLGREGPTVFLASGMASLIGKRLGAINLQARPVAACGAAAGLAAAFNTPIAGVTFVLEEILENLNSRLLGRILLASFVSVFVLYLARGEKAVLALPDVLHFDWKTYFLVPPVAAVAALAGVSFQKATLGWRQRIRNRSKIPLAFRPVAGALATWVAASLVFALTGRSGVLGLGYEDLNACLAGTLGLAAVAALLLGKWVATTASYAWGGCGGIFAPTLFLGAFAGALLAGVTRLFFDLPPEAASLLAVTGMSACLGAVVRAPATSILIVFEMTHDFALVLPLMLGALVSQFISRKLCRENFYTQVIEDDGVDLGAHRTIETFADWKSRKLAALATFPASSLPKDDPIKAAEVLKHTRYSSFPVVDAEGRLLGVVTREDWAGSLEPTSEAMFLALDATLEEAERKLVDAPLGLLVVTDPAGRPLGVFTLHDLLRCQLALMDEQ